MAGRHDLGFQYLERQRIAAMMLQAGAVCLQCGQVQQTGLALVAIGDVLRVMRMGLALACVAGLFRACIVRLLGHADGGIRERELGVQVQVDETGGHRRTAGEARRLGRGMDSDKDLTLPQARMPAPRKSVS